MNILYYIICHKITKNALKSRQKNFGPPAAPKRDHTCKSGSTDNERGQDVTGDSVVEWRRRICS